MLLTKLTLKVAPELISAFYPLLGKGFSVYAPSGSGIKEYLCSYLGIDADYFDDRIQTLFLDGSPVDDPESAQLKPGSILALSGAMPGLAGATLRRGGFYGRLRGEISYDQDTVCDASGECLIRVKVFNLLTRELGPRFLEKGIQIDSEAVSDLLKNRSRRIAGGSREAFIDEKPIEPAALIEMDLPDGDVLLRVYS